MKAGLMSWVGRSYGKKVTEVTNRFPDEAKQGVSFVSGKSRKHNGDVDNILC